MPRRQRFKPSRKPKPAIEPSESEIIQPTKGSRDQNVSHEQQSAEQERDDHAH
jgi:hypothetical protein